MTEVNQVQLPKKARKFTVLSGENFELYELSRMAGITMDPVVFRILLELLKLDVSPVALYDILQDMVVQASKSSSSTVNKKNSDNKISSTNISGRKKPPVAAKPKKIKNSFNDNKPALKSV